MSRRTGPRVRAMRALGAQLPELSSKSIERQRSARMARLPEASSVPFAVDVQLEVEFYSQRI